MSLKRSPFCILKHTNVIGRSFRWIPFLGIILNADLIFSEHMMLGPAEIFIKDIRLCDNPDRYPSYIDVVRTKINRTMEVFKGNISLHTDLDDTVGINVNVAKWGDGGYKPNYYILKDPKVCDFFFRWVGKDIKKILRDMNQPETCPLKKGFYNMNGYLVDYNELPKELVYGDFRATVLFIQKNVDILCYQWFLNAKPKPVMIRLMNNMPGL